MPLYEYLCKNCQHLFEIIQKFSDPLVTTCPKCGKENVVEQVLCAPAVQFKGSGFYVTDYAKKNSSHGSSGASRMESNSDSKSESSRSESKSDSKSDSKSEPKSDSKPSSSDSSKSGK